MPFNAHCIFNKVMRSLLKAVKAEHPELRAHYAKMNMSSDEYMIEFLTGIATPREIVETWHADAPELGADVQNKAFMRGDYSVAKLGGGRSATAHVLTMLAIATCEAADLANVVRSRQVIDNPLSSRNASINAISDPHIRRFLSGVSDLYDQEVGLSGVPVPEQTAVPDGAHAADQDGASGLTGLAAELMEGVDTSRFTSLDISDPATLVTDGSAALADVIRTMGAKLGGKLRRGEVDQGALIAEAMRMAETFSSGMGGMEGMVSGLMGGMSMFGKQA